MSRGWHEHLRRLSGISGVTWAERYAGASVADGDDRPDLSGDDLQSIFQGLFDRHARDVHRYLTSRAGAAAADDLLSDTFLIALQRRGQLRPGTGQRPRLVVRYRHEPAAPPCQGREPVPADDRPRPRHAGHPWSCRSGG
ncbi:sigma factor [Kibdelosporangium phytohabitans]|uniref:sigma factor n=1 Tax=Kibdelosporangium phytohabitans TaxID=860235 RepID=UPI003AAE61BA